MDAITNDDRKYLIKYSNIRQKLAKIDLYIFLHHNVFHFFHNYEGINNLKHVHLHLPLLNHPKLSQKDKGSFQDHSKVLVRLHPTLLDATCWFIRSLWTLLIDVGSELNEPPISFNLVGSTNVRRYWMRAAGFISVKRWRLWFYEYTHLLFIHGRVLWSWFNVNLEFKQQKKKNDRMISKCRQNREN